MDRTKFGFLDDDRYQPEWDNTSLFGPGYNKFSNLKQKSELEKVLDQSDTNNVLYNIIRQEIKKKIISNYQNAKRKILYHDIDKKVPILKDITIEQKKIDEFGPVLPTLEEKLVNDPDEKNIRVHHIPAETKIITHKFIQVSEALPPEPLEMTIHIPYGLYVLGKIEEEDKFYDTSKYFQHIRLLLNTIGEIEKQIGERISVKISCEDNEDINEKLELSNKEKQERSQQIFNRIQKHYKLEYPLPLKLNDDKDNGKNQKKGIRADFGIQWDSIHNGIFNKTTGREFNMLVNILGKDAGYFDFKDAYPRIKICGDLIDNGNNAMEECKRYLQRLFSF